MTFPLFSFDSVVSNGVSTFFRDTSYPGMGAHTGGMTLAWRRTHCSTHLRQAPSAHATILPPIHLNGGQYMHVPTLCHSSHTTAAPTSLFRHGALARLLWMGAGHILGFSPLFMNAVQSGAGQHCQDVSPSYSFFYLPPP